MTKIFKQKGCVTIRYSLIVIAFINLFCSVSNAQSSELDEIEHLAIIVLDGFGSEALQHATTPNLNRLIDEGFLALECRAVMPTLSSPNYVSMLTGASPLQHGVLSNGWRRNNSVLNPVATGIEEIFPSLFSWVRQQEPEAVIQFFHEWEGITELFEMSAISRLVHQEDGVDLFKNAMNSFINDRPRLMFVNIDETDAMGHQHTWESEEFLSAVSKYDELIGIFADTLESSGMMEKSAIIITGDHGGMTNSHGGNDPVVMNVPVIIAGVKIAAGSKQKTPCYIYDVAPTAASLMGVKPHNAIIGRDLFEALRREGESQYVPKPLITPRSGFYDDSFVSLSMKVDHPKADIYYTLDGSVPDSTSFKYEHPFAVEENSIVRAVSILDESASSLFNSHIRLNKGEKKEVNWFYYEGNWQKVPDYSELEAVDFGLSFEISLDEIPHRADHFGVLFKTNIKLIKEGDYRFFTNSDDGSILYVNGIKVVDNDGSRALIEKSGQIYLQPGIHEIDAHYFEDYMGEHIDVSIEGPGIPKQILTNQLIRQ